MLIVFGELAPKHIALARAERTALLVAAPIEVFTRILRPFIWVLNGMGVGWRAWPACGRCENGSRRSLPMS